MSDHQTIIVYRNPLEQYLWESGLGVAIILGMTAAGFTAITVNWLCEQYNMRWGSGFRHISKTQSNVIVILAIIAGVLPVYLMLR